MEELPNNETLAEYALGNYRDALKDRSDHVYSYSDLVVQAQKLIEGIGYPSPVVAALHDGLFPAEELSDTDMDAFIKQLQMLPTELLTFLMPEMYGRVTDRWMDEAIELATDAITAAHKDCFCDQRLTGDDPLNDPMPRCEDDDCPVVELHDKLLIDIVDADMLAWHASLDRESADEDLDYRRRLILACQRARLLTPAMAGTMVTMLYDIVQQNNET